MLIKHIKAFNLLSFGSNGLDLELQNLNVLIGPNGSGKSNFLEIFEILKALPRGAEDSNNLRDIINRSGGMHEWVSKIGKGDAFSIEIQTTPNFSTSETKYDHLITCGNYVLIYEETLYATGRLAYIRNPEGLTILDPVTDKMVISNETRRTGLSALSQYSSHPLVFDLSSSYERIRLYREWAFGRNTIFRTPQRADQRNDRLEPDFSNLGMFLSRLRKDPPTKRALVKALQDLYEGITDFEVITEGGTVQIFFTEGDYSIPATRLSDGTLRYLCLIALLLDPTPPPLICIEEPELGLHPDILPKIADMLVDASSRTQLIVTTHSDVLIDALSSQPESVLVCEKHEGQTQIKRLKQEDLTHWLKDYRLGQLWMRGEIGGTRW